jgi:hypothetical protein
LVESPETNLDGVTEVLPMSEPLATPTHVSRQCVREVNPTLILLGNEANSWWRVDLGEEMSVNNVVVFGRTDCCGERLSQFEVRVGSHDTFDKNEGAVLFFIQKTLPQP